MAPVRPHAFRFAAVLLVALMSVSLFFVFPVSAKNDDWSRTYTESNGRSTCVIAIDDGYVFSGVSNGCFLLAKTDFYGGIVWWKTYQTGGATCVIQTSDGGYAMAGYGEVNFIKTDSLGNLQWSKSYTYNNESYPKITSVRVDGLAATPEGGFILAGKTPSGLLGWDWTIKIDIDGNVLWGRTYGESYGNSLARDVLAVDDGYILAVNKDLLKINYDGDVIWRKPVLGADSLVRTSDGGLLMSIPAGTGNNDLLKTDSEGNILWTKSYRVESARETYTLLVAETVDGGILLCSRVYPQWEGTAWIIKTNSAGTPLWNQTVKIVSGYNIEPASIMEADNGEIVCSGAIVNVIHRNDTQVWLAKIFLPEELQSLTPTPLTSQPAQVSITPIADPPIQPLQVLVIGVIVIIAASSVLLFLRFRKIRSHTF